jgi:hypothetical protein
MEPSHRPLAPKPKKPEERTFASALQRMGGAIRDSLRWRQGLEMSPEHLEVILRFARGETELRGQAIEIFWYYKPLLGLSTPAMRFMDEVDRVLPDLEMRAKYRRELLAENPMFGPVQVLGPEPMSLPAPGM